MFSALPQSEVLITDFQPPPVKPHSSCLLSHSRHPLQHLKPPLAASAPLSSSPVSNAADEMQQVVVRKQGRIDYCSWSSRVLTLDPAAGVLLLSKKGNADRIAYHAMQPTRIEVWPYYNRKYVEEDFDSLPAKLTLRLAGRTLPRASSKRGRRVLNSAGMDFDEAWVLRFTSLQQFCTAVAVLEQLTHQQSRNTSGSSFGEDLKAGVCAALPAPAEQLLRPIRAAWDIECVKRARKTRRARILGSAGKDPLEMYR